MATSTVQICNLALSRCGVTKFIAALTEASNEARTLNVLYETTRDRVLEDAPWPFATRRGALQSVGSPPDEWVYRYRYPNDCLTARRILDGVNRVVRADQRIPFAVEEDEAAGGKVILCDQEDAILQYTARIVNPNLFTPGFVSALAWALAAEAASPLSQNPKLGAEADRQYGLAVARAFARSLSGQQEDPPPDSEFVTGRR